MTGGHFVHGQLIALCVVITLLYQGLDPIPAIDFIKKVGIDCSFARIGATREDFRRTLTTMADFVQSEPQLLPGVFHFFGSVPEDTVDDVLDFVERAFPAPKGGTLPEFSAEERNMLREQCRKCRQRLRFG